jgi:capsular polysaccharide biosynthesis protein
MEENQKGEQFRVLDPPNLPRKHVGPNRFKFSVGGLIFGIFLGVGLVAILELAGIRIRHEKDLKELVPALVLVNIPHLNTESEEKHLAMVQWMDFGAVTLLTALLAAGNVYAFFKR